MDLKGGVDFSIVFGKGVILRTKFEVCVCARVQSHFHLHVYIMVRVRAGIPC